MHEISFDDAVRAICERETLIDRDAYYFLREALEDTVEKIRADETPEHQHVNGPELMNGFREFALEKFGPMAATVLETWGIRKTDDVGQMVFDLIGQGAFGQSEDDQLDDFCGLYSFDDAFRVPFRPKRKRAVKKPIDELSVVREDSPLMEKLDGGEEEEDSGAAADSSDTKNRDTHGGPDLL